MDKTIPELGQYQVKQIRAIEKLAYKSPDFTEEGLMQGAGQSAWDIMVMRLSNVKVLAVFCGKGHNGGDGLYLAANAAANGSRVRCFSMATENSSDPLVKQAYVKAQQAGVEFVSAEKVIADDTTVVVDALLGIGQRLVLGPEIKACVELINQSGLSVCSLDIATGLMADTGSTADECIKADLTVSFIASKIGCHMFKGPQHSGEIRIAGLGLPTDILALEKPAAYMLNAPYLHRYLPKRKLHAHKGDFGHVLVVGGDHGMGGAVRMAAEAAMRVGAGKVTVATRPAHVNIVSGARPEIMCHEVNKVEDIKMLVDNADIIVCGPGLGATDWAIDLFNYLVKVDKPKVMDADALKILSNQVSHRDDWILTPHPGEAAHLLDMPCPQVQADRLSSVHAIQKKYGGVALLKGVGTLVADEEATFICAAGNPGMASAGMGDILSGILGGLLAQGLSLLQTAQLGVWVHARAADLAVAEDGERGLLATDLFHYLRILVNP